MRHQDHPSYSPHGLCTALDSLVYLMKSLRVITLKQECVNTDTSNGCRS